MNKTVSIVADRVGTQYSLLAPVEAVALAGSRAGAVSDATSDIDLYVYLSQDLDLTDRQALASGFSDSPEVGNSFWEPGDEWIDGESGVHVDVMFRRTEWIETQLARVLRHHEASVGYSTCLWANVLSSQVLFDRRGWFGALQRDAQQEYPEELRQAIIAKNFPILRDTHSAYLHQLERARQRGDWVSVNHRVAAFLASYFDVLFAFNRLPHPGEKRLLEIAKARCKHQPERMDEHVRSLLSATVEPHISLLKHVNSLVDGLEELLRHDGSPHRRKTRKEIS